MVYKLDVADTAKREVREAIEYIASQYGSPAAMNNLSRAYESALRSIQAFPNGFPVHEAASRATAHTIRRINVRNYGLFYEVHEDAHWVQIYSFLHSRQDAARQVARDLKLLF